jgi:cleavage and polyadenylation specificity factor subunit 4
VPHSAGVFDEDDDHGEDLLPSSLSDLLTPMERARRMSRRDSTDSFGASPRPGHGIHASQWGGERLAQSAGAALGPGNFLQSLWSAEGEDARRAGHGQNGDFAFGPATAAPQPRQSLLSQQRAPISPHRSFHHTAHQPIGPPSRKASGGTEWKVEDTVEPAYFTRAHDPSSPSARALQEHAPGQSLPGGVATALSRLHLHGPRPSSGLAHESTTSEEDAGETPPMVPGLVKRDEHEEGVFTMDG